MYLIKYRIKHGQYIMLPEQLPYKLRQHQFFSSLGTGVSTVAFKSYA